jgi:hypothetical protein
MRVYYFTNEEFGLSNIINERLKISMLDDLNDPFEFFGIDLSDKAFRKAFKGGRDAAAKMAGVICFCRLNVIVLTYSYSHFKYVIDTKSGCSANNLGKILAIQ